MRPIGGYHGMEIGMVPGQGPHAGALALNLGRNALELIIRTRAYRRVHVPRFTCGVLREPILRCGTEVVPYDLDGLLRPAGPWPSLGPDEALLYTNYFGLMDNTVRALAAECPNLILDNAQAYHAEVPPNCDAFTSCRKFFGVADGSYVHGPGLSYQGEKDISMDRYTHLLQRLDLGPEAGYKAFLEHEQRLSGQPLRSMSNLTALVMSGIDQHGARTARERNRDVLHKALAPLNRFPVRPDVAQGPLSYPFLSPDAELRARLHAAGVYTATYWVDTFFPLEPGSSQWSVARDTVHLPVDHRYDVGDMERIIELVKG